MANLIYPKYKEALLAGSTVASLNVNTATDGPYALLIDTGAYTYSASHAFRSDLTGVVGTEIRITSPTVLAGLFDGNDVTFPAVSGNSAEAIVIFRKNSGATSTQLLVAYLDSLVGGLPVTPNGGDILITWSAFGIFQL